MMLMTAVQVIRTDAPVHELVSEKELSAYGRFTRNKHAKTPTATERTLLTAIPAMPNS